MNRNHLTMASPGPWVRQMPWPALLLALGLMATPAWPQQTADPTRTFVEASRAYDEDRLTEAIAGWESLLNSGHVLPEVLYNLGNAYYRNGNLGPAIRAYRHAQWLAPRDPDIRANLGFAAQTAGISPPARHPVARLLLGASQSEWRVAASAAYWLAAAALAAWLLWPRTRSWARLTVLMAGLALALALAGLWIHRDLRQTPEWVVTADGNEVRSGPLETSTPLLSLPEGAIVRQLDRRGPWIEIQHEDTRGWILAASAAPIL